LTTYLVGSVGYSMPIYRCGNEFTNSISEADAKALNCKLVSGSKPAPPTKQMPAKPDLSKRARQPRTGYSSYSGTYELQVAHNDELFIINDEKFTARTYCFNMMDGDPVRFIEGSPLGACAMATFVNLRTKEVCEVWCE